MSLLDRLQVLHDAGVAHAVIKGDRYRELGEIVAQDYDYNVGQQEATRRALTIHIPEIAR